MARRPSVMKHRFSEVPSANVRRSSFERNHGYKTTFDSGYLVPVFVDEVLPGDTFNLRMQAFGRLTTPKVPFMDNLFLDSFFFFVPYRLVWSNWEKFCGEQVNPGDSTDFVMPQVTPPTAGYPEGSLADYFGIPTLVPSISVQALPFRAYRLIWNEWFRDENLQNSVAVPQQDGPDDGNAYTLLRRGKRHDYFTSCLPSPQKGPAIPLPLGEKAPVMGIGPKNAAAAVNQPIRETGAAQTRQVGQGWDNQSAGADNRWLIEEDPANAGYPNIWTDLQNATAATVNALRQSFAIQRLYERDARGGTRYAEILKSHFGVVSPDARLQRPEYLGGGSTMVNVSPVAQTSQTTTTGDPSPQGNLAAIGTVNVGGHGFTKSFVEHGVVIGMVAVRADLNYQQGIERMWSRRTRWDHFWPELAHIGEQGVLNKEIYAQGNATDDEVFGYQERHAEYRYKSSKITNKMRSSSAQSLDVWHLAQDFGSLPALNASFIEDTPPVGRVIAVPSEPQMKFDSFFRLRCARPMPVRSIPGMSGRM